MRFYDIGLVRPAILIPAVITTATKFLKEKVLKCLQMSKIMEIGLLIPAILPRVIVDVIKVVFIGLLIPETFPQVIPEVVDVGQV